MVLVLAGVPRERDDTTTPFLFSSFFLLLVIVLVLSFFRLVFCVSGSSFCMILEFQGISSSGS